MKKILYIFLTLSILSIGCSKEDDDITTIETTTTHLDSKLYGEWERYSDPNDYYYSFSSNGKWGYWITYLGGSPADESSGDWWIEGDQLFLQYQSSSSTTIFDYTVSGNTLTLNSGTWTKQ